MLKRFLIGLAVFAVLFIPYYFAWKKQADNYLASAQAALQQVNAPQPNGMVIKVEPESMAMSGFPFRHTLRLHNPAVTLEFTRGAMKRFAAQQANQPLPATLPGDETAVSTLFHLDGDALLSLHYLTTHLDFSYDGAVSGQTTVHGETLGWKSEGEGDSRCRLNFRKKALGALLSSLVQGHPVEWRTVSPHLKEATCTFPAQKLVATDDGKPLMSNAPWHFGFEKIHLDENAPRFLFTMSVKDVETFDRYSKLFAAIQTDQPPSLSKLTPFQQHEVVGPVSAEAEIGIAITNDEQKQGRPTYARIDAKTLNFSNNLLTMSLPFFAEFHSRDGNTDITLKHEGHLLFNTSFDTAMEQTLARSLEDRAYREALAAQFGAADKADTLSDYISDVLPKMSGFGQITSEIDLQAHLPEQQAMASGASVSVKKLRFASQPYDLAFSGSYNASNKQGFLSLDCVRCQQLLADAVEYQNRVQHTLAALQPSRQPVIVTPEIYDALVAFLYELNTSKEKDTLSISILNDGQGMATVSGKPLFQVVVKAMQRFGPLMSTGSPSTGQLPEPPAR